MKRKSISSKNSASEPDLTFKSGSKEQKQSRNNDGSLQVWTERNVFIGCLLFRIVNASLVHTYFNPDEHWQALEVAHRVVFGFVLPVLPITLMFSGYLLSELDKLDFPKRKLGKSDKMQKWSSWKYFVVFGLLITNIPAALYTSLLHQRGSEAVMVFLAREADRHQVQSVTFLMQCHATPYYASVHQNITMHFLDCSPRNDSDADSSLEELIDESDRFMRDPVGFVLEMFGSLPLPSHIVLFDSQAVQLREVLALHGYVQVRRFFHAHFPVDRELQGYVVVYQRTV